MQWALFGVLVGVIVYQGVLLWLSRNERMDLLKCIMARDYGQYIQGEVAIKPVPPRPESEYIEPGIPVV